MSKVQRLLKTRSRQASRTRPCPQDLRERIEVVNSIPPDKEFPDLWTDFDSVIRSGVDNVRTEFEKRLEQFPWDEFSRFREFIDANSATLEDVAACCRVLRDARSLLRAIAQMDLSAEPLLVLEGGRVPETFLQISTDAEGKLCFTRSWIVEALDGVEAARIRQCAICNQIFWAGRIDQQCCSTAHQKRLRTRRWSERYLDRYKLRRDEKAQQSATSKKPGGRRKTRKMKPTKGGIK